MSAKAIEKKALLAEPSTPSAEHKRLDVFVGKWDVEGQSYAEGQSNESLQVSSVKMKFVQTCEWLPGGFFLVNRWDGRVGEAEFNGMEVIGYDAGSREYSSRFFDNAGNAQLLSAKMFGRIAENYSMPLLNLATTARL